MGPQHMFAKFVGCGQEGSCSWVESLEYESETSQSDQSSQEEEVAFYAYDKKNTYTNRLVAPDINQLFAAQPKQQDYNPKLTYVWKIYGMNPKNIRGVLDQIYIFYACYRTYGTKPYEACKQILAGFSGFLKQ